MRPPRRAAQASLPRARLLSLSPALPSAWPGCRLYGKIQIALVSLVWYAILGPLAEARQHGVKPWSQSHYINEFIGVASGECLSKPPKVNYIVLCICMLIAIGVRARRAPPSAPVARARAPVARARAQMRA